MSESTSHVYQCRTFAAHFINTVRKYRKEKHCRGEMCSVCQELVTIVKTKHIQDSKNQDSVFIKKKLISYMLQRTFNSSPQRAMLSPNTAYSIPFTQSRSVWLKWTSCRAGAQVDICFYQSEYKTHIHIFKWEKNTTALFVTDLKMTFVIKMSLALLAHLSQKMIWSVVWLLTKAFGFETEMYGSSFATVIKKKKKNSRSVVSFFFYQ